MGLRPPFTEPLDDQHSAMESGAGITVRHENLRSGMGLRQATPHPEVLLTSSRHACYQRPGQVHLGGLDGELQIRLRGRHPRHRPHQRRSAPSDLKPQNRPPPPPPSMSPMMIPPIIAPIWLPPLP